MMSLLGGPGREFRTSSLLGKHSTTGLGLQTFKLFKKNKNGGTVSLSCPNWLWTHFIVQAGPEFEMLIFQFLEQLGLQA